MKCRIYKPTHFKDALKNSHSKNTSLFLRIPERYQYLHHDRPQYDSL